VSDASWQLHDKGDSGVALVALSPGIAQANVERVGSIAEQTHQLATEPPKTTNFDPPIVDRSAIIFHTNCSKLPRVPAPAEINPCNFPKLTHLPRPDRNLSVSYFLGDVTF
jgi:hypothetical protein